MTSHLPVVRLGDYCEVDSGFAFKSERFSQNPDDINLVKGSNLGHRTIDWDEGPKWPKAEFEKLKFYELITDDVVLAMDRPIVGGNLKFAWMTKSDPQALLVQRVARLRAKERLDQIYLRYVIADSAFNLYIDTITTGSNIPHISGPDIRDYKFPLPSINTQNKVAAILSAYDDLIENNLKRIKLLEEMAQITYEEWFVRLKFPGHETASMDSETGLPVGWEKMTCFDLMDVFSGGTPKTDVAEYWDGNIKFFTPKDAANCVYTLETEKTITELGLKKCNSKLYPKNTIFITARGTVGKLNLAREAMAMNQSCYALIAKNELSQLFLFCALNNAIGAFKGAANGGVFDAIVVDTFRYISIIKSDEELIGQFDSAIKPIFEQVDNLIKQNQLLKEARDILLPRLMTGMIDVEQLVLPNTLQVEGATCDEIS